jgi:hypothetical protein
MTEEELLKLKNETLQALAKPWLARIERYRLNTILYSIRVYRQGLKQLEKMKMEELRKK